MGLKPNFKVASPQVRKRDVYQNAICQIFFFFFGVENHVSIKQHVTKGAYPVSYIHGNWIIIVKYSGRLKAGCPQFGC